LYSLFVRLQRRLYSLQLTAKFVWDDNGITLAWLGHATVLVNFYGVRILTAGRRHGAGDVGSAAAPAVSVSA